MARTIRLNDLQLVLLSSAAARENGSLIPLPETCAQDRARISKAVAALLRRGLVSELQVTDRKVAWREQEQAVIGLFITDAGRVAIGAEPEMEASDELHDGPDDVTDQGAGAAAQAGNLTEAKTDAETSTPASSGPRSGSKIAVVVALLERKEGATLAELVDTTGWLPHTKRAALTGLRKKGLTIGKTKRGDVTCYRIEAVAAA